MRGTLLPPDQRCFDQFGANKPLIKDILAAREGTTPHEQDPYPDYRPATGVASDLPPAPSREETGPVNDWFASEPTTPGTETTV